MRTQVTPQVTGQTDGLQALELDEAQAIRRSTVDLYSLLGALGERLYLEAMSLCDTEAEAAAWASANLVKSLEDQRLLGRLELAP